MQNYPNARKRPLGILRAFGLSCFWELIQITSNSNHQYLFSRNFPFYDSAVAIAEILVCKLIIFETI